MLHRLSLTLMGKYMQHKIERIAPRPTIRDNISLFHYAISIFFLEPQLSAVIIYVCQAKLSVRNMASL